MLDHNSRFRISPVQALDNLNVLLSVVLWSIGIYYVATLTWPRSKYAVALFSVAFLVYIIDDLTDSIEDRDYLDIYILLISMVIIIVTAAYLLYFFRDLLFVRRGIARHDEYVLALTFTLTMFYLIYRAFGLAFLAVIGGGGLYAWLGPHLPSLIGHGGLTITRILNVFLLDFSGFFGGISQIVAAWVALFLLYAGLLQGYGAFDYVMRLAFKSAEYIRSGIAQSAVVASLAVGSINGAQTANAAMTGSITIPLMKESNLKASTAAAIEAVASSGGQIMPPVMGAAAFIMANILGITYVDVIVAGLVPALVFYISTAIAVHYAAINENIKSGIIDVEDELGDTKSRPEFILETVKLGIPFGILIYTLGILQITVFTAALYTSLAMIITGIIFPFIERLLGWREVTFVELLWDTLEGAKIGAITFGPIAVIVAAINAIVDVLVTTGVPGKLALALFDLSGGVLLMALFMAMLICIILGLGMPTVAAYVLVALLVAPALIEGFGLPRLPVHYFVFYAAILSGITPPIAISVVVTTGIAQSNFWATAYKSVKIAAPLFVLPFAFIYNDEIILGGFGAYKILSSILLLAGAAVLVHGLNYYGRAFGSRILNFVFRLFVAILGVLIMAVPWDFIRFGILLVSVLLIGWQVLQVRETTFGAVRESFMQRF